MNYFVLKFSISGKGGTRKPSLVGEIRNSVNTRSGVTRFFTQIVALLQLSYGQVHYTKYSSSSSPGESSSAGLLSRSVSIVSFGGFESFSLKGLFHSAMDHSPKTVR